MNCPRNRYLTDFCTYVWILMFFPLEPTVSPLSKISKVCASNLRPVTWQSFMASFPSPWDKDGLSHIVNGDQPLACTVSQTIPRHWQLPTKRPRCVSTVKQNRWSHTGALACTLTLPSLPAQTQPTQSHLLSSVRQRKTVGRMKGKKDKKQGKFGPKVHLVLHCPGKRKYAIIDHHYITGPLINFGWKQRKWLIYLTKCSVTEDYRNDLTNKGEKIVLKRKIVVIHLPV